MAILDFIVLHPKCFVFLGVYTLMDYPTAAAATRCALDNTQPWWFFRKCIIPPRISVPSGGFYPCRPPLTTAQKGQISGIEGKNIWRLTVYFSFCMDLADSIQHWPYLVEAVGNRLHVKLSSVRLLIRNRSMRTYRLDARRLGSDLATPHSHTVRSARRGSDDKMVRQCLQQRWWGRLITQFPVELGCSEWSIYLVSRLWSCT